MSLKFFDKTDKSLKLKFFYPLKTEESEEAFATADSEGIIKLDNFIDLAQSSYRQFQLLRSKESLEDKLERLLRNAEIAGPEACDMLLEQMVKFLKDYPELVNRAPNKFHSNPLELALKLGVSSVISALLEMKAQVRPENMGLLKSSLNSVLKAENNVENTYKKRR